MIVLLVGIMLFVTGCTRPPEGLESAGFNQEQSQMNETVTEGLTEQEIDQGNSLVEFEGYGPGKSHVGTIQEWNGTAYVGEDGIEKVEATFDMDSVDTGIGGLDKHLKSEDFYYTEEYPTATFETLQITENQTTALMNFRGVTQEITIPTHNLTETLYGSEFLLNMSRYGIDFPGVYEEVRMKFVLTLS